MAMTTEIHLKPWMSRGGGAGSVVLGLGRPASTLVESESLPVLLVRWLLSDFSLREAVADAEEDIFTL